MAAWWRRSSAARPPRTDPPGAGPLYTLERRARAAQTSTTDCGATIGACQRLSFRTLNTQTELPKASSYALHEAMASAGATDARTITFAQLEWRGAPGQIPNTFAPNPDGTAWAPPAAVTSPHESTPRAAQPAAAKGNGAHSGKGKGKGKGKGTDAAGKGGKGKGKAAGRGKGAGRGRGANS